jgi:hypothetical protein
MNIEGIDWLEIRHNNRIYKQCRLYIFYRTFVTNAFLISLGGSAHFDVFGIWMAVLLRKV